MIRRPPRSPLFPSPTLSRPPPARAPAPVVVTAPVAVAVPPSVVSPPTSAPAVAAMPGVQDRSEEHTSELQSRSDLVCRLLLEKKKNRAQKNNDPCRIAYKRS